MKTMRSEAYGGGSPLLRNRGHVVPHFFLVIFFPLFFLVDFLFWESGIAFLLLCLYFISHLQQFSEMTAAFSTSSVD